MFALLQKATPTAYGLCPETLLPETTNTRRSGLPLCPRHQTPKACWKSIQIALYQRHLMPLSNDKTVTLICRPLKNSSMTDQSPTECSDINFIFVPRPWDFIVPVKKLRPICSGLLQIYLTCFKACSSRLCLETESLHTVSQRVLSSWSCPLTHVVSSLLFSISSLPDRFRT